MEECAECELDHIEDAEYRGHELVISRCGKCGQFIVDARADDYDGAFIAGFINPSVYDAIKLAESAVDKYDFEQSLTVDVPF